MTQLSGFTSPILFLKATHRRRVHIAGYTRDDGVFVPPHETTVLVADDHDGHKVASGQGSHYQQRAHRDLSRSAAFNGLDHDHRVNLILHHATVAQDAASQSAALSGWKTRAFAGQNPTPGQWTAFRAQTAEKKAALLAEVQTRAGGHGHLQDPGGPASPAVVAAHAAPVAPVAPAAAPAASTRPSAEGVTFYHGGVDVPTNELQPLTFFSADRSVAHDYLSHGTQAGAGRVHAVRLAIHNPASDADVEAAAREVGIYDENENAHQFLTESVYGEDAKRVMAVLKRRGFDGAAVTDMPITGGAPIVSWAIFSPSQVQEVGIDAASHDTRPATAEFRGVQYRRTGNTWEFRGHPGAAWGQVRSSAAVVALNAGQDPNPADERVTPPAARGAAPAADASSQEIGGVGFTAVRKAGARGGAYWIAKVTATGQEFPDQQYATRSAMWDDLSRSSRVMGDRFAAAYAAPTAPTAAATPAPVTASVNDMDVTLQPDGSWETRGGGYISPTSPLGLAASFMTGRSIPSGSGTIDRSAAVDVVVRGGRDPIEALNAFFPAGSVTRAGSVKTVNGIQYVLRDGRWHRVTQDAPAAPRSGPIPRVDEYELRNTTEGHNKFWAASVQGNNLVVRYGPIGSNGTKLVKHFGSPREADAERNRLMSQKRRGGYEVHLNREIDGVHAYDTAPAASAAPAAAPRVVGAREVAPAAPAAAPAASVPSNSVGATADQIENMGRVPVPDFTVRNADTRDHERRVDELSDLAAEGNLDGLTNYALGAGDAASDQVAGFRAALLAAAQGATPLQTITAMHRPIPTPPTITGANPNNSALLAARRKVVALQAAAQSADPVAALMAIPTSRGNGYLNAADDYKKALLLHFGANAAGVPVPGVPAAAVPPHAAAAAPAPVAPAAPAVRRVTSRRRAAPAAAPAANVPPSQNPEIAANPLGLSEAELGFVPRPNVPQSISTARGNLPVGFVWPHPEMEALNARYLAQHVDLQHRARAYQNGTWAPETPEGRALRARQVAEAAERERAAAAAAVVAAEAARVESMRAIRASNTSFINKLAAQPDLHQPKSRVGANITSYSGDMEAAGRVLGVDGANMKEIVQRMVCDFGKDLRGNVVTFRATVTVTDNKVRIGFEGSNGTSISRRFDRLSPTDLRVEHCFFQIPKVRDPATGEMVTDGEGGGKALFRTSLGCYKSLGITKIRVHANIDVGGYAWAKYGFKIDQNYWDRIRAMAKNRAPRLGMSAEGRRKFDAICADTNPLAMFVLSDFKDGEKQPGKECLLGSDWYGTLDLEDDFLNRRCMAYIVPRDARQAATAAPAARRRTSRAA